MLSTQSINPSLLFFGKSLRPCVIVSSLSARDKERERVWTPEWEMATGRCSSVVILVRRFFCWVELEDRENSAGSN
ncbi:hypothetical protein L1987_20986 [Smallanthus sonchifolius]|uniref:Uncharacterized protein n=1 Tax=Smallanthus sonchifolius TaxID=185202 RepID=A0ACB9IT48_9ASTR|nr:hypothetical protein L1987_20986 [Smallanthus sonchifolius]